MKKLSRYLPSAILIVSVSLLVSGCVSATGKPGPLQPLYDLFEMILRWINGFVHNYGWSIIIMTILLKLLMLPLDIKQKHNMRRQTELQPKINALQEKYKNDREKLSQKQMELYKQEGFSPLSGCLPMLIQWPVFIAFFGALRAIAGEHVFELYQAVANGQEPLIQGWLWVHNMWQPDSFMQPIIPNFNNVAAYPLFHNNNITQEVYLSVMQPLIDQYSGRTNGWFILPILAGASSFLQAKMTMANQPTTATAANAPGAGTTKAMQYMMPLISIFFCSTSNALFAIYWTVSNIISVITYRIIDRLMNKKQNQAAEAKASRR